MNENELKILENYNLKFKNDLDSFDEFSANDYIKLLKNNNLNNEAIEVGKTFLSMRTDLKRYINQYGYALYNKFINIDDNKIKEKENLYFDILEEIIAVCKQESFSPLEPAINRTIKYLLNQETIDYKKIVNLYDNLDPNLISAKPFINKENKEYESRKEHYYRILIKSLFELKEYNRLIDNSNKALNSNIKWHFNAQSWIKYYRGYALNHLGRYEEAQREFLALNNQIKGFNFYKVLYDNNFNLNNIKEANSYLLYEFFLKGYSFKNIELYERLYKSSILTKNKLIIEIVSAFLIQIAKENNYKLTNQLEMNPKYEAISSSDLYDTMYDIIMNNLKSFVERKTGNIIYYNQDKQYGSISVYDNDPIFFRQSDFVYDEIIERRDSVSYTILPTYDSKKDQITSKAILITAEDDFTTFID